MHRVRVEGLWPWLDVRRLLGPGQWAYADGGSVPGGHPLVAEASLEGPVAADVEARLRGCGVGGLELRVEIEPRLPRALVRAARAREARRMRETTPGFLRVGGIAQGEGRFSLTPEALALRVGELAGGRPVVDACAGAGGNSIGFARAGCRVIALERDPARLRELRHNLRVYGVQRHVSVAAGDALERLSGLRGDLLFADPPWGHRYDRRRCELGAIPLLGFLLEHRRRFREVWLKLPPSFAVEALPDAQIQAFFGEAPGDARRVKFLLARMPGGASGPAPS